MTVTHVGSLSIGAAVPGAAASASAGVSGINGALPDIQARIAALLQFAPQPVDFAAQLALAQSTVTSIQAAIAGGLSPPSIDAQLAEVAAQVAALQATLASVEANLDAIVAFQGQLVAAGIHVYVYRGQVQDLGTEMDAELSGGLPGGGGAAAASDAIVLITEDGATWSTMEQVFKVTP